MCVYRGTAIWRGSKKEFISKSMREASEDPKPTDISSWRSSLQKYEKINFCCSNHLVQYFVMADLANEFMLYDQIWNRILVSYLWSSLFPFSSYISVCSLVSKYVFTIINLVRLPQDPDTLFFSLYFPCYDLENHSRKKLKWLWSSAWNDLLLLRIFIP